MEVVPSQTLYINNINEKVKIDVLKKMFYMVFSQYGKVVDIVAKKGLKMRGQAWVVFQDTSAATNAMRGKQGFNFYGKPLVSISTSGGYRLGLEDNFSLI
jgi:RNA recognition motif-containing protein